MFLELLIVACSFTVLILIFQVVKAIVSRQRNAKKAANHIWAEVLPLAGKVYDPLVPIDGNKVRIKDSSGKVFATYVLGRAGIFPAAWPPGKSKFVQTTVDKIIYREGDAEPLSNVTGRPLVSAKMYGATIEESHSADAMKLSLDESTGLKGMGGNMMVLYVILGFIGILGIANVVFSYNGYAMIDTIRIGVETIMHGQGL